MKKIVISIIVVIAMAILIVGVSTQMQSGQKHQYKFWPQEIKLEGDVNVQRVFFSHSSDYGITFSEPRDMSMTNFYAHEPKMIVMHDDVVLVWRDEVESDDIPTLSFAKSTDFGETFEKKRLFFGARPDIIYYDQTLYLTFAGLDLKHIWYSESQDGGETFSEPKLIFEVDWDLSPYEDRPTPTIEANADEIKITWRMQDKNNQNTIWNAVDKGKDGSFEITSFIDNSE
ncbi:MAG: glycoside hydrolase [Nitrosarchaeum sp.]|nr:glycoside hydrolase [Nitrosarchaeum sp.]